jgi:hypothetical protein
MPWITITEADLLATKMAPLVSALRSAAIDPSQDDPVTAITADVIARVRNKVSSCSTNKVEQDATKIPASLKALACRMIIREAKGRLDMDLTEDERTQQTIDERELTAVSRCELVVDQAETPETPPVQALQPGPTINARTRRYRDQDGV